LSRGSFGYAGELIEFDDSGEEGSLPAVNRSRLTEQEAI